MPTGSRFGLLNNMHAAYQSTYIYIYIYVMEYRTILWQSTHGMAIKKEDKYLATYRLLEGRC